MLHGFAFNIPLHAMQVDAHTGELPATHSFVTVKPENLVLTAMKKSEDGNSLILRFYEWAGKDTTANITVPEGASGATVTNLMEKAEGTPLTVSGDHLSVPVGKYPSTPCGWIIPIAGRNSGRRKSRIVCHSERMKGLTVSQIARPFASRTLDLDRRCRSAGSKSLFIRPSIAPRTL